MFFFPVLISIYFIGGLLVLFAPQKAGRLITRIVATALFFYGVTSISAYLQSSGRFAFDFSAPWISSLGSAFHFGTDGISYPLVLLTLFLGVIVSLISLPHTEGGGTEKVYWALLLWLLSGVVGVFASLDLLVFYIFWEVVLILMFFLIALYGGENRKYASMKFLIYTQFASLVMLLAIIDMYLVAGARSFDILQLSAFPYSGEIGLMLTLAFLFSFLVKMPAVPFHTWLPDAHVEAPTAGSIILAGVLLKMGAYGILRIPFTVFPDTIHQIAYPLGIFAFVSILYGAFVSLAQDNLKRMIAYSSVNHMGYVLLGIAAASPLAIKGSVYEMVAHGLGAGLLFAVAGHIHDTHKTFSISSLKGLMKITPITSWFFVIGALAAMGLPTMAGFIAEFTIFTGAFAVYRSLILIPLIGVVVTAGYFIWTVQRSFWGSPAEGSSVTEPKTFSFWLPYVLLAAGLFFFGLWPSFLFKLIEHGQYLFG